MITSPPQVKDRGLGGFVLSREYRKLRLTVQELELGTLRQITPARFAAIERRLEVVGNREPEELATAATFDASNIPDGTMLDFAPSFVDDMAACIRGDGKPLNDDEFEQLLRACGISDNPR